MSENNSNKINFLTFANSGYNNLDRIANQAKQFPFNNIYLYSEKDIPEFIKKHREFINSNKQGFGFWIWKPKVILDVLNKIDNGEILVYCDSGIHLNVNGLDRFQEYINILDNSKDIITFSTNDYYKAKNWVKNDAIMSYWPQFNNELSNSCYAGLMILKKTENSLKLISEWLELCENYHFLDRSQSIQYPESSCYKGNDCDNGLFQLVLSKFNSVVEKIYPDEVNIYHNGMQVAHCPWVSTGSGDWLALNNFPFHYRRDSPRYH